jgi:hypothetical protein
VNSNIKTFEPWITEALLKHLAEGGSVNAFHGTINMTSITWTNMLREIPELNAIRIEYNIRKRKELGTPYKPNAE